MTRRGDGAPGDDDTARRGGEPRRVQRARVAAKEAVEVAPPQVRWLLTTGQAAELLGVSEGELLRSTGRGEGPPALYYGSARRYRRRDVERWRWRMGERAS